MDEILALHASNFADPRILCPTSGKICPAREQLITLHTTRPTPDVEASLPPELHPKLDEIKLSARLTENAAVAGLIGCAGTIDGVCPVREDMNQSKVRTSVVSTLRLLLRKVIDDR